MYDRLVYAAVFGLFIIFVGRYLNRIGYVFLSDAFAANPKVADAVSGLLNIGFYKVCIGLLLWNVGIESERSDFGRVFQVAALRLGISVFVVGFLHSFNVLVIAILSRKSTEPPPRGPRSRKRPGPR